MSSRNITQRALTALISLLATTGALAGTTAQPTGKEKPPELSLVVLDKKCEYLVEPFTLTGNLKTIAESMFDTWYGRLTGQAANGGDISDAARLKAKRTNWLPMKSEVMYGERAHALETNVLTRDSKMGKKLYPLADGMLAEIDRKIGEEHDYTFQLFILKNATRNAIARPGGFLYIDQGLLDDPKQRPKAYFALAHEIAHVLQRHETRELQGMIVDSFQTKKDLQFAITQSKVDPAAVLNNLKISKDSYTRHHVDQELQADSCSARLLSRVYTERPKFAESVNAFLKDLPPIDTTPAPVPAPTKSDSKAVELAAAAHDIVTTPASRHPNTLERTQNLRSLYTELTTAVVANQ